MKVLSLDISTSTGWALLKKGRKKTPNLVTYGVVSKSKKSLKDYGEYPFSYLDMAQELAAKLLALVHEHKPDIVVVEETNKAKAIYTQKALEWIHCCFLNAVRGTCPVIYIRSSAWRKAVDLVMTKDDKKNNAKVRKANQTGKSKQELGVKGKITPKHLAVRRANELYGLELKLKDNDVADALLLAAAYFLEAPHATGL